MALYEDFLAHSRSKYNVLPVHTEEQFETLADSIKGAKQVYVPIVQDEHGQIIDGDARSFLANHFRIRSIPSEIRPGLREHEKINLALVLNAHRRHLDSKMKRELIRQQLLRKPTYANLHLGRVIGCSENTVKAVRHEMEQKGEIPIARKVERKNGRAYPRRKTFALVHTLRETTEVLNNLARLDPIYLPNSPVTPRTIRALVGQQKRDIIRGQPADGTYAIYNADMRELLPKELVKPGSVHLIMTDPFYHAKHAEAWSWLGTFARATLAEDGLLAAYTGQSTLPDALEKLREAGLRYHWLAANVFENHNGSWRGGTNSNILRPWTSSTGVRAWLLMNVRLLSSKACNSPA